MRDKDRSLRRNLAWMEKLSARLRGAVRSQGDLLRPDVLRLSRHLDRVALRLMRRGCVRSRDGWALPGSAPEKDSPGQ